MRWGNIFAFMVLLTGLVQGALNPFSGQDQQPFQILEGGNIDIFCNSSEYEGYNIFWESSDGLFRLDGNELLMSGITRDQSGSYACHAANDVSSDVIQTVVIEVLYPAKIINWSFPYSRLRQNRTYEMVVDIEGKPAPDSILLVSQSSGAVLYRGEGNGEMNVTLEPVQCGDTGTYDLHVTNDFNSASVGKNVTVYCVPYVNPNMVTTFDKMPRLGETTVLEMNAAGFPQPNFTWSHNGSQLQHSDDGFTSKVTIESVDVNDYGIYQLDMENSVGKSRFTFYVVPSGPPEPPGNLTYIQCTSQSATVSWVPGYDYNQTQTFVIINDVDGDVKVLEEFTEDSSEYGSMIVRTIDQLVPDHKYNITVTAKNRNGTSNGNVHSISFKTKKKPFPIGIMIGILASPIVIVLVCSFAIKQSPKLRRQNKTNELNADVTEKTHLLHGNNENADRTECYDDKGPPDCATYLQVRTITNTSATLSWLPGKGCGGEQTFTIIKLQNGRKTKIATVTLYDLSVDRREIYTVTNLTPDTTYKMQIQSSNSKGDAARLSNMVKFTTQDITDEEIENSLYGTKQHTDRVYCNSDQVDGYIPPDYTRF